MTTKSSADLTLKDRLSRLTSRGACKLLGADGERLILRGGKYEVEDFDNQVALDDQRFRLDLRDAIVSIRLRDEAKCRLQVRCSACSSSCVHAGAALSLILEEKTALGLAKPPPERKPVESLREEELIARALAERQERARAEKMRLTSPEPGKL